MSTVYTVKIINNDVIMLSYSGPLLLLLHSTRQMDDSRIQLLEENLAKVHTEEKLTIVREFKPRSTDVIVAGCCKSGTTWMQQIIHQLRTGGDMEFTEIAEIVPQIEHSRDLIKLNLDADQKFSPRCFKTHHLHQSCPEGAKYIYCLREPCSVAYSAFKMLEDWFFQSGEISLEEYVRDIWLAQHDADQDQITIAPNFLYFHHLASWWPHRNDPNVLVVFFEDLKELYESCIRSVAKFMGITDESSIQAALEKSTFTYMKQNGDKFDQKLLKQSNKSLGLAANAGMNKTKIRTGTTTEGRKMLSVELHILIQQKWDAIVAPVTGCSTYEELRAAWNIEENT